LEAIWEKVVKQDFGGTYHGIRDESNVCFDGGEYGAAADARICIRQELGENTLRVYHWFAAVHNRVFGSVCDVVLLLRH